MTETPELGPCEFGMERRAGPEISSRGNQEELVAG